VLNININILILLNNLQNMKQTISNSAEKPQYVLDESAFSGLSENFRG
jgi:hypothetical protein